MSLVDNSWETDSDGERGPPEEYFRLKYDNVTKVKFQLKKIVNFISRKYKKIDSEAQEKLKIMNRLIEEEISPSFGIKQNKLYSEDGDLDKVFIVGNEYNLIKKPEVGSALIFELNSKNNNLNFVGISKEFYEATTKIFQRSRLEDVNKPKVKSRKDKKKKNAKCKKVKIEGCNNEIIKQMVLKRNLKLKKKFLKIKADGSNLKNSYEIKQQVKEDTDNIKTDYSLDEEKKKKKKKRKKKIKKYIRNSTIITINKIK